MKKATLAIVAVALLFAFSTPLLADGIPAINNGHLVYELNPDPPPKWIIVCRCIGAPPYDCICSELPPGTPMCYIDWLRELETYVGENANYLFFKVDSDASTYSLQTPGSDYMSISIEWAESFD